MSGPIRSLARLTACLAVAACSTAQPSSSPSSTSAPTAPPTTLPTASPTTLATATASPPAPTAVPTVESTGSPTATPGPGGSFDPSAITLTVEPFADVFQALSFVANAGDGTGRLFAVEQRGVIWLIDAQGTTDRDPLLNISDRVRSGGEQGLLGLAFHPDFASNGRLFVDYTDVNGDTVVSEFGLAADGRGVPESEDVLLHIDQPFANHNGGMLAFGPDGYLYIGTGDGGSGGDPQGNGQNLDTLLGKILRIDVDAGQGNAIPIDNPFAAGGGLPEIWSYGLRNPWRFSFDRLTGAMFIADVGQNAWEEVDAEPAGSGGRNYGWNIMEGERCYAKARCLVAGLTLPVAVYPHDDGCSITGGYVYRGSQFPALYGGYVFADYCTGTLWALDAQDALEDGSADITALGSVPFSPSSFGEDELGELYVVDHGGAIYQLAVQP